ncbi:MAG: hypothetical protein ACLFSJ_01340, partial [Halorhodospira sp.]
GRAEAAAATDGAASDAAAGEAAATGEASTSSAGVSGTGTGEAAASGLLVRVGEGESWLEVEADSEQAFAGLLAPHTRDRVTRLTLTE